MRKVALWTCAVDFRQGSRKWNSTIKSIQTSWAKFWRYGEWLLLNEQHSLEKKKYKTWKWFSNVYE
jgi:hypothetical protein